MITAGGAAFAVYLAIRGQRSEDQMRIRGAVLREVIEFSRLILGHLETYDSIGLGRMELPGPKLIGAIVVPAPTIYPAIADRIGLLPSPQIVVAFYCRIAEIVTVMVPAIANHPDCQERALVRNDVSRLVEASFIVLELGRRIIEFAQSIIQLDEDIRQSVRSDIEVVCTRVSETFPTPDRPRHRPPRSG